MKALVLYLTEFVGSGEPEHATLVKTAFINGGGITADLYETDVFNQTVIDYAALNNYDAIIFSVSGEESYFDLANSNPDIMIFMPSDFYTGDLQQLVLTDLLPSSDNAEFYDNTQSFQSYSNGYICGQLFYIAEQRDCSLQEARICANATKDEDGIIDVDLAIAYTGTIQLTVGDIIAERTESLKVDLTLERIIDATNYKIKVTLLNGDLVEYIETTSLTYEYTLPDYDVYLFSYQGYTTDLESEFSDTVQEGQISFQFFLIQEEDMAFGLAVSDYNIQTGTYGTIIKVDLSEKMAYAVRWVQGENASNIKSDVVENESELSALYNYMEDESCPDLAWSFNGIILTIFFKIGICDTRFAFEFVRNPHKTTSDSSLVDVLEEDIELVQAYALESFYKSKNLRVPYTIQKTIQEQEERIENAD